jgi:hypothetical protein
MYINMRKLQFLNPYAGTGTWSVPAIAKTNQLFKGVN